jgi:signal transduction histidine kinase
MARKRRGISLILILAAVLAPVICGQTRLTLEEASARRAPTYAPAHDGEQAIVEGVVAARFIKVAGYCHLLIEDAAGHGLTLEGTEAQLGGLQPGDVIEVQGTIANRAGLPVLQPAAIRVKENGAPPPARKVKVSELNAFQHVGTLVVVDSTVITIGDNAGGEVLLIGSPKEVPVRVFLPRDAWPGGIGLNRFSPGDHVSVAGFSSQYCPNPPYNRAFQVVIGDPSAIKLLERGWILPPELLASATLLVISLVAIWWMREHRMSEQRRRLRSMTGVAEEIISATTPGEISRRLVNSVPRILHAADVHLYLFNRHAQMLDRVPTFSNPEPFSVNIQSPIGKLSAAVALAFRNRTFLHIPDTRRSPILRDGHDEDLPRAILLVPMFAQQELLGILTILFTNKIRKPNGDEQAGIQHLSNQVATSLKLQEQQSIQEQLLRSEKMAAAGQLISGVAKELRGPLGTINRIANGLLTHNSHGLPELEMREIAYEAHRGSELVSRLVSFSTTEQTETKPLNVNFLVGSLMEFREPEWNTKGVQARDNLPQHPAIVLGNQSQLEQVMLNLLVHAEQSLVNAPVKSIAVSSRNLGRGVVITIDYSDRLQEAKTTDPFASNGAEGGLGLQVCQAILQGHGGEVRLLRDLPTGCRFEIELPLHQFAQPGIDSAQLRRRVAQQLTVLIVEPETSSARILLAILSERGHRGVPVISAEEAVEMVFRLHFDIVFCAIRLPGLNWVEFHEKIRHQIGAFVLMAEGHDPEISRAFKGSEGYILSKPLDEIEAQKLLATIEERQETLAQG